MNAVTITLAIACYCGGEIAMPHLRRSVSLGSIFYENGAPTELENECMQRPQTK
jgi:hypothetical protein